MKAIVITVLTIYSSAVSSQWIVCKTPTGGTTFCRSETPLPAMSPPTLLQPPATVPATAPAPPVQVTGTIVSGQQPKWCNNGKPQNATESVICNTKSLWAWDAAYNDVWKQTPKDSRPDGKMALDDRDRHIDPNQIASWYQSAIGQLKSGSVTTQSSGMQSGGDKMDWCNKKLNPAESRLCAISTTAIATLDRQINDAYKAYKKGNDNRWQQEKQKQKAWLEQRNAFLLSQGGGSNDQVIATQILQMYQSRVAELQQ